MLVVTWRGAEHVAECLDALTAQTRAHRLLVVDNASDDGTADVLAAHPSSPEVVRLPRNTGYAGGIATGLSHVDTEFVAWLNDDAAPEPGWLAALEDAMTGALPPDTAAVASRLEHPDGAVQSTGVRLTADGHGSDATDGDREPFGFCGGAVLARTDRLRSVGGVPAEFFCYYEDTDTAWRLRLAGASIGYEPGAVVRHRHGASTRPGSPLFHRWNERNRLLTLVRCAPAPVAARELARFAVLTALLPLRRGVPDAANFRAGLRLRVLGEVALRLPAALGQRRRIGDIAPIGRGVVWRRWAGR